MERIPLKLCVCVYSFCLTAGMKDTLSSDNHHPPAPSHRLSLSRRRRINQMEITRHSYSL